MSLCASHDPENDRPSVSADDLVAVRYACCGATVDEWCDAGHYYRLEVPAWGIGVLFDIESLIEQPA